MQKFGYFFTFRQGFYILRPQNPQGDDQDPVDHHAGQNTAEGGQRVDTVGAVAAENSGNKAAHGPRGGTHHGGSKHRLDKELDVSGLLGGVFPHEEQVQHADGQVAAQGGDGRAMDVDLRVAHKDIVHDHLHYAAGDHGENRQLFLAVGLQDGVGQDHQADEDQGDAENPQVRACRQRVLRLHGQHQDLNGRGQHGKADACRQSEDGDEPEGGGDDPIRLGVILPGQRRCGEGDQAHGDGVDEGGHHIGHIHGDAVLAVQHGGGLFGKAQTVLQAAHDDLGVDDVDDAHGGVAQRDGDADEQDLLDDLAAGGGNVQRLFPVLMGSQIGKEEQHGDGRACCDADNGPGGAQLGSQADV